MKTDHSMLFAQFKWYGWCHLCPLNAVKVKNALSPFFNFEEADFII